MKRTIFAIMACLSIALTSCNNNAAVTAEVLDGAWDVVWIDGVENAQEDGAFIGFDTKVDGVYGNAGCNAIMGTFELSSEEPCDCTGLKFGSVATTRMMCEDMATEEAFLAAINATAFCSIKDGELSFCDADQKVLAKLQRRPAIKALTGRWNIVKINDSEIAADSIMSFVEFDTDSMRMHANAGCNEIISQIAQSEGNDLSIAFTLPATTMKACEDMETEKLLIEALNATASFQFVAPDSLLLKNADGSVAITAVR